MEAGASLCEPAVVEVLPVEGALCDDDSAGAEEGAFCDEVLDVPDAEVLLPLCASACDEDGELELDGA